MCNQTSQWALDQASKAEQAGDLTKAEEYQEIAESCITEETPMEIPSGSTGYFVKAENRGVTNFLM
jgi:hypothetical protein